MSTFSSLNGDSVTVRGFAKVNLGLWITGTDTATNGETKHTLETIYYAVPNLFDELTFTKTRAKNPSSGKITIEMAYNAKIASEDIKDEDNIVTRTIQKLAINISGIDLHVKIKKNIPIAAGLAGGSADAAATILALEALCMLRDCTNGDVAYLGADVPFSLMAARKLNLSRNPQTELSIVGHGSHFGEVVELFKVKSLPKITVHTKPYKIYTKTAFCEYDHLIKQKMVQYTSPNQAKEHVNSIFKALNQNDIINAISHMSNDLQIVALNLMPSLKLAVKSLQDQASENSKIMITGSGPTIIKVAV